MPDPGFETYYEDQRIEHFEAQHYEPDYCPIHDLEHGGTCRCCEEENAVRECEVCDTELVMPNAFDDLVCPNLCPTCKEHLWVDEDGIATDVCIRCDTYTDSRGRTRLVDYTHPDI